MPTTGFRSQLFAARLLARTPPGRVAGGGGPVARWVLAREQAQVQECAIERGAVAEYLALSNQRRQRVKQRAMVVGAVGTVTVTGTTILVSGHPERVSILCGVLIAVGEWSAPRATRA